MSPGKASVGLTAESTLPISGVQIWLPYPPSVNSAWRSNRGRVHKSQQYKNWLEETWALWLIQKPQGFKPICSKFRLSMELFPPDRRIRDADNSIKVVLDWAQHVGIIKNDHLCKKINVSLEDFSPENNKIGALVLIEPLED